MDANLHDNTFETMLKCIAQHTAPAAILSHVDYADHCERKAEEVGNEGAGIQRQIWLIMASAGYGYVAVLAAMYNGPRDYELNTLD